MTKNAYTYRMDGWLSPSSRGLGLRPFTAATGVRLPLGTPSKRFFHSKLPFADNTLQDCFSWTGIFSAEKLELQIYCTWGRSSSGRAQRWQRWGKGFDPPRLHQPLAITTRKPLQKLTRLRGIGISLTHFYLFSCFWCLFGVCLVSVKWLFIQKGHTMSHLYLYKKKSNTSLKYSNQNLMWIKKWGGSERSIRSWDFWEESNFIYFQFLY